MRHALSCNDTASACRGRWSVAMLPRLIWPAARSRSASSMIDAARSGTSRFPLPLYAGSVEEPGMSANWHIPAGWAPGYFVRFRETERSTPVTDMGAQATGPTAACLLSGMQQGEADIDVAECF